MNASLPAGFRRLALCFDGTWNNLGSRTNVSKLYDSIASFESGCDEQLKFYDEGVGVQLGEKLFGGAFGYGLSRNILQGYCWLVNTYKRGPLRDTALRAAGYDSGDQVFLFGFSRGAFTARSLGGLINRLGLIDLQSVANRDPSLLKDPDAPNASADQPFVTINSPIIQQAWNHYRVPPQTANSSTVDSALASVRSTIATTGRASLKASGSLDDFKAANCIPVRIRCLGVWDTVGALGIPSTFAVVPGVSSALRWWYQFHDTGLCKAVQSAFHAMAVDEHRKDYNVTAWDKPGAPDQEVDQVWFPGAHANVGGGYDDDLLPAGPLRWLAEKAANCGLEFRTPVDGPKACAASVPPAFDLDGREFLSPIRDSYAEFMLGIYRMASAPFFRRMMIPSDAINQKIHETVRRKWDADAEYRPSNYAHAGRMDFGSAPANKVVFDRSLQNADSEATGGGPA